MSTYKDEKLTYSNISDFAYRKKRVEKAYKSLMNIVSGTNESYWDDNQDSSIRNEVSSKFIETLELYRGRRLQFMGEESLLADLKPDPFSKEDRKLYSTFMDTVMSLAVYNEPGEIHWYSRAGTWDAVIERIEQPLSYKNPVELHKDLIVWNEIIEVAGSTPYLDFDVNVPEGIFYSLSCAYKEVTGENLSSLLTKKQREAAKKIMTKEEKKYLAIAEDSDGDLRASILKDIKEQEAELAQVTEEEVIEGLNGDEEAIKSYKEVKSIMERWGNPTFEQVEAINRNFKKYRQELRASLGIKQGGKNDWKASFDADEMKKACRLLLEKGVDLYNRRYFKEDCINTLHITLSQCGIGSWLDDVRYNTVYGNMREVIRFPRKVIRRPGKGIKDEVLTKVRADYTKNQTNSFLYDYIVKNNEKLKKKIKENPEKKDAIINKYIQDTMNNYGYPVTIDKVTNTYKKSTKAQTSNPPLEMIDAWYRYYSMKVEETEETGNEKIIDLPVEEFDRFYKSICKSETSDSFLIPLRIDSKTGAGLYIIGRNYYAEGDFKYPDSFHCGIDLISDWVISDDIGISQSIAYFLAEDKCDSVIEANNSFESEIVLDGDIMEEFHKMNGIMPPGCPKRLQKYFKSNDSEDKKE